MKAGAASVDVTPHWPVQLAGFSSRGGLPTDECAAPIHVRAVVLESRSGSERICIMSAELLNWPREREQEHRRIVAHAAGVDPGNVILCATHNHSAPQPNTTCCPSMGVADGRFLESFTNSLVEAAQAAADRLEEVVARRNTIDHDLGRQRRIIIDGAVTTGTNLLGPDDSALTVVGFYDVHDRIIAGFVHYTCHAVVSAENVISGDFPGYACSILEQALGGVFLYLQGCCGDINPGSFTTAGIIEAERVGRGLAASARRALDGATSLGRDIFSSEFSEVALPMIHDLAECDDEKDGRLIDEWRTTMAAHPERVRGAESLTIRVLHITEDFGLVSMNGELSVEYGLTVRRLSGGRLLPVAYSDGMIGYVPRQHQLLEGGYEPVQAAYYYGLAGRFSPGIEKSIDGALAGVSGLLRG